MAVVVRWVGNDLTVFNETTSHVVIDAVHRPVWKGGGTHFGAFNPAGLAPGESAVFTTTTPFDTAGYDIYYRLEVARVADAQSGAVTGFMPPA